MSPETAAEMQRIRSLVEFRSELADRAEATAPAVPEGRICKEPTCDAPIVRREQESPGAFAQREFCCYRCSSRFRERTKRLARAETKRRHPNRMKGTAP